MKVLFLFSLVAALAGTRAMSAQSPGTPSVATNQCWDRSSNQLRDKNSAAMGAPEGRDRSAGPPPPSGNAGNVTPKVPNAVRPPGVADC